MDTDLQIRFTQAAEAAQRAEAAVVAVAGASVGGDLAERYATLSEALEVRLGIEHDRLAELETSSLARNTTEQPGSLTATTLRYGDLFDDARRLLAVAPLLSSGEAALAAWRVQSEDSLAAPELLQPCLDTAARLAFDAAGVGGDPAAAEAPERGRAVAMILRDSKDRASRALALATTDLAAGKVAPAAALTQLARAQTQLSNALDDAFENVFLAALGLQRPDGPTPGLFAFKARAARQEAARRRTAALVAFDAADERHTAYSAAADFLDPEALAGGSLDPVSPYAVRAWWDALLLTRG